MSINKFDTYMQTLHPLAPSLLDAMETLNEKEFFIKGYLLVDPAINYTLLTENDFKKMIPEQHLMSKVLELSPYKRILVIIYMDDEDVKLRIVNGRASHILEKFDELL